MTYSEMAAQVDRIAMLGHNGLAFAVRVCDAKTAYGNTRYFVTPCNGTGAIWVDAGSIRFLPESR